MTTNSDGLTDLPNILPNGGAQKHAHIHTCSHFVHFIRGMGGRSEGAWERWSMSFQLLQPHFAEEQTTRWGRQRVVRDE